MSSKRDLFKDLHFPRIHHCLHVFNIQVNGPFDNLDPQVLEFFPGDHPLQLPSYFHTYDKNVRLVVFSKGSTCETLYKRTYRLTTIYFPKSSLWVIPMVPAVRSHGDLQNPTSLVTAYYQPPLLVPPSLLSV